MREVEVCPCIGQHVESTGAIGSFRITSTSYNEGSFRIVFKAQVQTKIVKLVLNSEIVLTRTLGHALTLQLNSKQQRLISRENE